MRNEILTITLTRTDAGLWAALVVTTALGALYVWSLWHRRAAPRHRSSAEEILQKWQGTAYLIVGLFFLGALLAAGFVLFDTIRNVIVVSDGKASAPNLGAGALIAAILGAPFVIWGTVLKYQTLRHTKEGHITDRISKAVEQLGAEKKVDRIGRPVTLLSGEPKIRTAYTGIDDSPTLGPEEEYVEFLGEDSDEDGLHWKHSVRYWPERRTVIEWRGEALAIGSNEKILERDKWQLFSESQPNIEVRIGGLLSLERISQDSVKYDKGRDHVRVMEILCAYVRNNAPATDLLPTDLPFQRKKPRLDVQKALDAIKRRSEEQRHLEVTAKFQIDLRETDLDGCDLSNGNFQGAIFWRSRFEAANLAKSDLTGAKLSGALLNFADFYETIFCGTCLRAAIYNMANGPDIGIAKIQSAFIEGADVRAIHFRPRHAGVFVGSKDTIVDEYYKEDMQNGLRLATEMDYEEASKTGSGINH